MRSKASCCYHITTTVIQWINCKNLLILTPLSLEDAQVNKESIISKHDILLDSVLQRGTYTKLYSYTHLINGFALNVTSDEVLKALNDTKGVITVIQLLLLLGIMEFQLFPMGSTMRLLAAWLLQLRLQYTKRCTHLEVICPMLWRQLIVLFKMELIYLYMMSVLQNAGKVVVGRHLILKGVLTMKGTLLQSQQLMVSQPVKFPHEIGEKLVEMVVMETRTMGGSLQSSGAISLEELVLTALQKKLRRKSCLLFD